MPEPSLPIYETEESASSSDVSEHVTNLPGPEEHRPQRSRRVPTWLKVTLLLVAIYVLSIGPMFWVWYDAEYFTGNLLIRVFYAPLRLLCGFEFIEDLMNRYINWWIL